VADGLTMVLLIRSDSDNPDATAHCLGWVIRPELGEAFAEGMTETCGEPGLESLAKVSDLTRAAQRNEDGIIYATGGSGG
jgi:hypothetical protein